MPRFRLEDLRPLIAPTDPEQLRSWVSGAVTDIKFLHALIRSDEIIVHARGPAFLVVGVLALRSRLISPDWSDLESQKPPVTGLAMQQHAIQRALDPNDGFAATRSPRRSSLEDRVVEFARGGSGHLPGADHTISFERSLGECSCRSSRGPSSDRSRQGSTFGLQARASQFSLKRSFEAATRSSAAGRYRVYTRAADSCHWPAGSAGEDRWRLGSGQKFAP